MVTLTEAVKDKSKKKKLKLDKDEVPKVDPEKVLIHNVKEIQMVWNNFCRSQMKRRLRNLLHPLRSSKEF